PVTYVVRRGDSVYKIAQKFGTTMQAIILANNLCNPDLIFPGQVLIIPCV
ncbi:MAG TPA: LysM peptidoglycan-binding domain-containing protein, partial [Desulfitobacterium dehalogenans]|nr:LysM peptidoglycan-binding domain-containing protein [Desulfitobacterium dehalogenans]